MNYISWNDYDAHVALELSWLWDIQTLKPAILPWSSLSTLKSLQQKLTFWTSTFDHNHIFYGFSLSFHSFYYNSSAYYYNLIQQLWRNDDDWLFYSPSPEKGRKRNWKYYESRINDVNIIFQMTEGTTYVYIYRQLVPTHLRTYKHIMIKTIEQIMTHYFNTHILYIQWILKLWFYSTKWSQHSLGLSANFQLVEVYKIARRIVSRTTRQLTCICDISAFFNFSSYHLICTLKISRGIVEIVLYFDEYLKAKKYFYLHFQIQ